MATIRLPTDFKEFLKLLNSQRVEYLVVGGYAVAFHGHPRATGDLDLWIAARPENAERVVRALRAFGFSQAAVAAELLATPGKVLRMGVPPLRIELLTSVSGVDFDACHARRQTEVVDGIEVPFISLPDLHTNKRAAGRKKDLADLDELA